MFLDSSKTIIMETTGIFYPFLGVISLIIIKNEL